MKLKSRIGNGRREYEVEPGRWVSKQRVNQLRNRKVHCARRNVQSALRSGTLQRQPCEKCGKPEAQFHHWSYDDAFAIIWLCDDHHKAHLKPHSLRDAPIEPPRPRCGRRKGKWILPKDRIELAKKSLTSAV